MKRTVCLILTLLLITCSISIMFGTSVGASSDSNVLANYKASNWFVRSYGSIDDSTDTNKGGNAYFANGVNHQKMVTTVTLEPNTTYNLNFDWKTVLPDDNSGAGLFPSFVFVYPKSVIGEITDTKDSNAKAGSGKWNNNAEFFPTVGDGKLDANDDIETATDAFFATNRTLKANGNWNTISTNFTTTEDTEYVIMVRLRQNDFGVGKNQIILSDFALEKAAENFAASYSNANGAVTWTENAQVRSSSIDSTANSVNGGRSWKFGLGNTNYTSAPAYVYIKATKLKANAAYDFSYIYQGDFVIVFDGIKDKNNNPVAPLSPASDTAITSGDRAHQVAVTFKAPVDGDYTIILKMGKGKNNTNCKYDAVTLCDLSLLVGDGKVKLTADVIASGNGDATVSNVTPDLDSEVTYTAVPWQGEDFLGWYNDNLKVSDALTYTFKISENTTLIAKFTSKNTSDLSSYKAADWLVRSYGSVTDSTDTSKGGNAYLANGVVYQKMITTVNLKPNTTYNFNFDWKAVLPDDNSGAGLFPSHVYVYPMSVIGELTDIRDASATAGSGKWNNNAEFFPKVGDGKLDANDDIETATDAYFATNKALLAEDKWNTISTSFETTDEAQYVIMIRFRNNDKGNGKNQIILSDLKLEKAAENLASDYTNANGAVTWSENAAVRKSSIDSKINSVNGGHSWEFGIPETEYTNNPAYVYIKTDELPVGRYEFSFVYQKDYRITFDSIDSDAIVTKTEEVKLSEGDRAYRVIVLLNITKTGSHTITLKMGKGRNNDDCKWDKVILSDIRIYDIANRVYGTVKSELGGTVSGFDASYCNKGDAVTVVATPNNKNTFDGWFNDADELVSTNAEYKFIAENDFVLTARFSGNNIPNSEWLSEHGMDGTFENGTMTGWKAEDRKMGDSSSWTKFLRNDFISYNGDYALRCVARYRTSIFNFYDLKKHTDYLLTFYVNLPDDNEEALINWFSITSGGVTLYTDPTSKAGGAIKGGSGWHKVNLYFNTGEYTNVDWNFYYVNGYGHDTVADAQYVYLDDVFLVGYNAQNFANGDFSEGEKIWRGDYTVSEGTAKIENGKDMRQNVELGKQNLYTLTFKAKGKGTGGFAEVTKGIPSSGKYVSSESAVNIDSDNWKTYSLKVYSGINPHASLFFNATEGELLVDDVVLTKADEKKNAVVEKVDFETDRFTLHNNSDVFEIYNGTKGDVNVYSGTKSLRFNSANAMKNVEYIFDEAFVSAQIAAKINYKLTLYYKTIKGNTLYIAPEYLAEEGIETTYTAAGNGWTKVEFMFSKTTSAYIKITIANILNKTKGDFYIDDITLSIAPPMVLETNSANKYCEWPLNVLNNQGFEEKITNKNWANLPKTTEIRSDKAFAGNNYLRIKAGTYYVLPVQLEAGDSYYFSISSRFGKNSLGYVAVATNPAGTTLYNDMKEKPASKIVVDTSNWNRDSFLFSTSESGIVYLVFASNKGYIDVDEVHLYKRQYGKETDPNDHNFVPFNFKNPNTALGVLNGGDPTFSGNELTLEYSESPNTGDNRTTPAIVLIISTIAAIVLVLTQKRIFEFLNGGKA